tara:strand:- start:527 stop:706 length:180 start_codon:yes stop_codon:yes gene_type:complete
VFIACGISNALAVVVALAVIRTEDAAFITDAATFILATVAVFKAFKAGILTIVEANRLD